MSPYEETKAEFEKNLKHGMTTEAWDLFDEIYMMTIQPALAKTKWEGEGRSWVLKQVGKIARKAQAEPVSRDALARAANHQIPLASEACRFNQAADEDEEPAREEFGLFCVVFRTVEVI